jgi:NAD(P)-dependent dehydrogenase (short-subunit alcohol dehydrogenase family)
MDWGNTRAVVTGGSTGIGKAVLAALTERGAKVTWCSRKGGAGGLACDVREEADVARFADAARAALGGAPTLLVNNAGIAKWGAVAELSVEDWDAVLDTNVRGMFLVTRAFLPAMLAAGHGTIVNISSLSGRNPVKNGAAYAASKHAVLGFSKSLMLEVRQQGVRVVAVCPGSVDTPIFDDAQAPFDTHRERMMRPEDIAQIILDTVALPERAMVSELDIRPTRP